MMDKSKTPRCKVRWRHDPKWVGGVLDSSIIQGPFSVAQCQTLKSRFATFSSPYSASFRPRRSGCLLMGSVVTVCDGRKKTHHVQRACATRAGRSREPASRLAPV
jgi:hypothetical protein